MCDEHETKLSDGRVVYSGQTFGETVTYSCDLGFSPVEPMVYYCEETKQWNGTAPTCEGNVSFLQSNNFQLQF